MKLREGLDLIPDGVPDEAEKSRARNFARVASVARNCEAPLSTNECRAERRVHARFAIAAAAVATGVEARICFVVKYCTGIAEVCEREEQRQID